eukprot:s3074_g7.t1
MCANVIERKKGVQEVLTSGLSLGNLCIQLHGCVNGFNFLQATTFRSLVVDCGRLNQTVPLQLRRAWNASFGLQAAQVLKQPQARPGKACESVCAGARRINGSSEMRSPDRKKLSAPWSPDPCSQVDAFHKNTSANHRVRL